MGQEYIKYLADTGIKVSLESRLYVKEIRPGSIVAELYDLAPLALPFAENINTIIGFTRFLKKSFDWFLGGEKHEKEPDYVDMRNIYKIVNPVAKDLGSQLNVNGILNIENLSISLSSLDSNAVQNSIRRYLELSKTEEKNYHEKVLFYWDTTKFGAKSTAADKGLIDSVFPKPLKVIFENDKLKKTMIHTDNNFFFLGFIVDAEVMTIGGIPTVYKIKNVHESIQK